MNQLKKSRSASRHTLRAPSNAFAVSRLKAKSKEVKLSTSTQKDENKQKKVVLPKTGWNEEFKKEDYVMYIKIQCINCDNSLPGTWEYYQVYGNFCRDCNSKCTPGGMEKKISCGYGGKQI